MSIQHNTTVLISSLLLSACVGEELELAETQQPIINYGSAQLDRTWMKASHNTYEPANTYGTNDITWHFANNSTMHIELDLRDTHANAPSGLSGNWVIAHEYSSSPTLRCGGAGAYTLSWCLFTIQQYHLNNPGHALITVQLDKKQDWQNLNQNTSSRSPWRLDNLISAYFPDSALFTPANFRYWWTLSGPTVRANAQSYGWPAHSDLAGKIMFIMTSDVGCTGNDRQEAYVDNRGWNAKIFIAPNGNASSYVTTTPQCFDAASTAWVAIYGFEWVDSNNDGECDSTACSSLPLAHDRRFLTRVYDIDDPAEYDKASRRPFGTGTYGHANFIAIDQPWNQYMNGGYGVYPDGIYPW